MNKEKIKAFNGKLVAVYYEDDCGQDDVAYGKIYAGVSNIKVVHSLSDTLVFFSDMEIKKIVALKEDEILFEGGKNE